MGLLPQTQADQLEAAYLTVNIPRPHTVEEAEAFVQQYSEDANLYLRDVSITELMDAGLDAGDAGAWIRPKHIQMGFNAAAEILGREQIRRMVAQPEASP